ncbi:MAG: prevent-host-death family protein [Meiothermus sp.]
MAYNIPTPRARFDRDIHPISEFRDNAAAFVEHVQQAKHPLVITQHGRSAAVLLDVGEYEQILKRLDKLEIMKAVDAGIRAVEAGRVPATPRSKNGY